MVEWPQWWSWELELTPHVLKRMEDRDFTEVELRKMMERARGYRTGPFGDRWILDTEQRGKRWEVVVEPDQPEQVLVVVTAYPTGR